MNNLEPTKFLEGLNQNPDPEIGGFQELENVTLEEKGVCKPQHVSKTDVSIGSAVHSVSQGAFVSSYVVLHGYGTNLAVNGATGLVIKSDWSATKTSFAYQSSRVYACNEVNGLWYYNNTTPMYRAGANVPLTAPTAAAGSPGGFTGTYSIVVTFYSANGFDGNPSSAATTGAIAADEIDVTNIPVNTDSEYNIAGRKIWIQGGTTPYYADYVLIDTIADNTTTSSTGLDTTDVDSTTLLEEDNDVPPLMETVVNHYDTFFGIGCTTARNDLAYSKAGLCEQWPATQRIKISHPGDSPTSLVSWDGVLWVLTKSKVYQVVGSPGSGILSSNFYVKATRATKGSIARRSAVGTPYGLFYMAIDGIYKCDGNTSEKFSDPVSDYIDRMTNSASEKTLAVGCYFDNKLFMSIAVDGVSYNNVTLVHDFESGTWQTLSSGYNDFYPNEELGVLFGATQTGVDEVYGGTNYAAWKVKTKDYSTAISSFSSFGEYQVESEGTYTVNVRVDDQVVQVDTITTTDRRPSTRLVANQMGRRMSLELIGAEKATQDKLYSITVSAEIQRGDI